MLQTWHTIKGGVAAVVAFAACPCHLPITLPLLIALTTGTAFGTWLENNTITVGVILTVIFIGGLGLAYKWMNDAASAPVAEAQAGKSRQAGRRSTKARKSERIAPVHQNGVPKVTLVTSSTCSSCKSTKAVWEQAREHANFKYEEVNITSSRGRKLAAKHNIFSTPATIVDDHVVKRGKLDLEDVLAIVQPDPTGDYSAR